MHCHLLRHVTLSDSGNFTHIFKRATSIKIVSKQLLIQQNFNEVCFSHAPSLTFYCVSHLVSFINHRNNDDIKMSINYQRGSVTMSEVCVVIGE